MKCSTLLPNLKTCTIESVKEFVRRKYKDFPELKILFEKGDAKKYFSRLNLNDSLLLLDARLSLRDLDNDEIKLIRNFFESELFDISYSPKIISFENKILTFGYFTIESRFPNERFAINIALKKRL